MTDTIKQQRRVLKGKHKDLIFYCLMIAYPILQFCIFYIGVNANSFLLAFQRIDPKTGLTVQWTFTVLQDAFKEMTSPTMLQTMKLSLQSYFILTGISIPLSLFFSYYIYKKMPFANAFKVILFVPSIISGIVMVSMYRFFIGEAIPDLIEMMTGAEPGSVLGLLDIKEYRYPMIVFFNIWCGFGSGILMYSNAMSGISTEVVESAHLDGSTGFSEFWHITLPLVFPTLSTFLITGVAGIFGNSLGLFSFYGDGAKSELWTYGYYLYVETKRVASAGREAYPRLSAFGMILTCVVIPVTFLVRFLLEKFGPSQD
ncbi:MAG: sugar ABC transporter permease [Clostridia bacterium]|nr:sugar ABC transporter permease [Clostridia bacterium]